MDTKKERDEFETDLEELEVDISFQSEVFSFIESFNKPELKNGKSRYWVVGVAPQYLELQARIMEMKIGLKMSYSKIGEEMGYSKQGIIHILKKYKPKQGKHDITMNIMSKV